MNTKPDSITITVSADDLDEAVQFAVTQLQAWTVDQGHGGFTAPVLAAESFEIIEGVWTRVFRFASEFLPGVK